MAAGSTALSVPDSAAERRRWLVALSTELAYDAGLDVGPLLERLK